MTTFAFRIQLNTPITDQDADRVYEAAPDEVSLQEGPKGNYVGFDREAPSFLDAVLDAITTLIQLGLEPLAVEDELVSVADIAQRTGRTRQSVSMLVSGQRGPGGFPRPIAGNARTHLWNWTDVTSWFQALPNGEPASDDRSQTIAAVNGALANRLLARERPSDRDRIRAALGV
jgi:hypothetical protein